MNLRGLIILGALSAVSPALAVQPTAHFSLPSVAAMKAQNLSSKPSISIDSYYGDGMGGGGDFTLQSTPCTEDFGNCIHDGAGHSFVRDKLSGDLHQYGAVKGSVYDCSPTTGHGIAGCTRADTIYAALAAAAVARGVPEITTGAVQVAFAHSPIVPSKTSLTCGAVYQGKNNDTGLFNDLPGSIYLDHGATVTNAAGSGVHHCNIIHAHYASSAPWTTIRQQIDYWGATGTAVTDSDTGLLCDVTGCNNHDLFIAAFDTGYQSSHSGEGAHNAIKVDGNIGLASWHNLGHRSYKQWESFPYTTHSLNGVTAGDGSTTWNDANSEWWTITGIVDDGTGKCKIQSTEHSTADIHTGDQILIDNLGSRDSCAGIWTVTKSGSDLILNGSVYAGLTTTGDFVPGRNIIRNIAGDMRGVWAAQTITGVSGIEAGSQVIHVTADGKFVSIDCADHVCITGTGTGVSIHFANDTTSAFNSIHCDGTGPGTCMWLEAQTRHVAGNSVGGQKAGHIATSYMIGGPDGSDQDVGFFGEDLHSYARQRQLHVQNSKNGVIVSLGGDTDGNTNDRSQIGALFDGDDTTWEVNGHDVGKLGTALEVNITNSAQRAVHYINAGADATDGDFNAAELLDGSVIFEGNHGTAGAVMVGHLTGPIFANSNLLPNGDWYYENETANGMVMGGANAFASGYVPTMNNNSASAKTVMTGSVTVGSATISGATFDTTGVVDGMGIAGPNGALQPGSEVQAFTPAPCTPSCTVTMTKTAKATVTGAFKFKGLVPAAPGPIPGAASRVIAQDGLDGVAEMDTSGGTPGFTGVRSDGSMVSPTAVQSGEDLAKFCGQGFGATVYPKADNVCLHQRAIENHTDTAHGTEIVLSPTEKGKATPADTVFVQSGGVGIMSGTADVVAPLDIQPPATTFTLSTINALGSSSTGDVTVSSATGLPSPGILYVDAEAVAYTVKNSTTLTVTARAQFGTSGATHANASVAAFVEQTTGHAQSAAQAFTVLSNGRVIANGSEPQLSLLSFGATPDCSTSATTALTNAETAALAQGVHIIRLDGTAAGSCYAIGTHTVPAGIVLYCPGAPAFEPVNNDYRNFPNAIRLTTNSGLTWSGQNALIGCTELQNTLAGSAPPTGYQSNQARTAAFAGNANTLSGDGLAFVGDFIVGFQNCFVLKGGRTINIDRVQTDCLTRDKFVTQGGGGNITDTNFLSAPFATRSGTGGPPNELYLPFTTIADNGAGAERVTLSSACTTENCPLGGYEIWMSNVAPYQSAQGGWMPTVVDSTHIDLIGSNSAFLTGYSAAAVTVTSGSSEITGVPLTYINQIQPTQTMSGTCIPASTYVLRVERHYGIIWMGNAGKNPVAATCSSAPTETITITDAATGVTAVTNAPVDASFIGTGFAVGDTVQPSTGTVVTGMDAVITITAVDGSGGVLGASVSDGGQYTVCPSSPSTTTVTNGTGSGLKLDVSCSGVAVLYANNRGDDFIIQNVNDVRVTNGNDLGHANCIDWNKNANGVHFDGVTCHDENVLQDQTHVGLFLNQPLTANGGVAQNSFCNGGLYYFGAAVADASQTSSNVSTNVICNSELGGAKGASGFENTVLDVFSPGGAKKDSLTFTGNFSTVPGFLFVPDDIRTLILSNNDFPFSYLFGQSSATAALVRDAGNNNFATGSLAAPIPTSILQASFVPYLIAQVGTPATAPASTSEVTLATIPVPANAIGANGCLTFDGLLTFTGSTNLKTFKIYLASTGTTPYLNQAVSSTSAISGRLNTKVCNANATNVQIGGDANGTYTLLGTVALTSGAVDTTAATSLIVTGQKAVSGETMTLQQYSVLLEPHA